MSSFLFSLAVLSLLFTFWQWLAARSFPIHKRGSPRETPAFSILKPLKGTDGPGVEALRSWFELRSASEYEILLGLGSRGDPLWGAAEKLIEEHPGIKARLVLCEPVRGPNAKVSKLTHLLGEAQFEHIIISDDDVVAPVDLLEQIGNILGEGVALGCTFYTFRWEKTLGNKWEAVATNSDFWSQVLQGVSLQRMDFALGAVMATTRGWLERIGKFEPLLEYLADDYQLGQRIAKAGGRIALCAAPVECDSREISMREAWAHQLRWARTIRTCRPVAYFFSILSNGTLWPLLYVAVARSEFALGLAVFALVCRSLTAWDNYRRITRRGSLLPIYFAPVKDVLQVFVWGAAFLGNRITWRGEKLRVTPGGKLVSARDGEQI